MQVARSSSVGKIGQGNKKSEELEGELKRVKNFLQTRRDTYLLKAHILLIKKYNWKLQQYEYKTKYDLTMFSIVCSAKEKTKLILEPKPSL
jgi:hypothetical protein